MDSSVPPTPFQVDTTSATPSQPQPVPTLFTAFDGVPAVVRIFNEDVFCILHWPHPEGREPYAMLERPMILRKVFVPEPYSDEALIDEGEDDDDELIGDEDDSPTMSDQTGRPALRFFPWIPSSSAGVYPVILSQIVTFAPATAEYADVYLRSIQHYYRSTEGAAPTPSESEEQRTNAYHDFLLHQDNTGKYYH